MSNGKKNLLAISVSENGHLMLAAFVLAVVIWAFAKAGETDEARIQVPVVLTLGNKRPDGRMQYRVDPTRIPVVLRYPKRLERYISSENFRFEVDAEELRTELGLNWSEKSQPLTDKNFVANVPDSRRIELVKIGTGSNTVDVRMRWNAQPAIVEPQLAGQDRLDEGYQLVSPVSVNPREVWIVGETEALDTLPRDEITSKLLLRTDIINVAGQKQTNLESVAIQVPPGIELVQPKTQVAEVNLEIQEVQTIREIPGIRVDFKALNPDALDVAYKEKTATVTVFGPPSLLNQLTPASIEISFVRPSEEVPGTTKDVQLDPHLSATVPADIKARVVIRSITPKSLKVTYSGRSGPAR